MLVVKHHQDIPATRVYTTPSNTKNGNNKAVPGGQ